MTKEQALDAVERAIDIAFKKGKELSIHSASDCFSFARYLNENFHYFDNTGVGDVYKDNDGKILITETTEMIHNALEWANKRLELQGEPITENQRNYIFFALRQQLTIPDAVGRSEQCCSPTDGFYLGTTCPHCKKPFRKDIR